MVTGSTSWFRAVVGIAPAAVARPAAQAAWPAPPRGRTQAAKPPRASQRRRRRRCSCPQATAKPRHADGLV
eukprot:357778-Chlamydomonas_euryale.AAC.4